ncbi:MAG: hypothetical protein K6G28_00060, partial [Acholeplasmatales bacterium]|nr:hypothetical protein [Acholeplasmatales bacterium]
TGYYLNIIIPVYVESINNKTFISFLNEIFNFYKINSKFIYFKIIGDLKPSKNLDELKKSDINMGVTSLDLLFLHNLNTLYLDYNKYNLDTLKKFKSILNGKNLILSNVKSQADLVRASEITNLVSGETISKAMSINNLINQLKK